MANNYTMFSTRIPADNQAQIEALANRIRADAEQQDSDLSGLVLSLEGTDLLVYPEESGSLGALADVVCQWQKDMNVQVGWAASCAATCDKPREDEFGGAAVVCYRGECKFLITSTWASDALKEMEQKVKVKNIQIEKHTTFFALRDSEEPHAEVLGRVVTGTKLPGGLEIALKGYGNKEVEGGAPIYLEHHEGKLRLHVWADINEEEPTHTIDLDGAREELCETKGDCLMPSPIIDAGGPHEK